MTLPWYLPALWVGLCLAWRKDATQLALLGYHVLCLVALRPGLRGFRWGRIPRWGWVLLGALAAAAALLLFLPPLPRFPVDHLRQVVARWPGGLPVHALYVVAINVPLEEVFWRSLQERQHPHWSPWRHGAAFGLHHLAGAIFAVGWNWVLIPAFLGPVLAGAFWTWCVRRQGGLALPLFTHALADLGIMAIAASQL